MKYRFRYYLGKFCKFLGFCRNCRVSLNFTRNGVGICPCCASRF